MPQTSTLLLAVLILSAFSFIALAALLAILLTERRHGRDDADEMNDALMEGVMEVRGHSWETILPARSIIYTRDLYEPGQELAARSANAARNVLESTPPELAADVSGTGILLTGGGSLLRGLAGYIAGELHTDVAIAPDPLNCVARGTAISLSEGKYLSAGFRDATPKVWNRRLNHSHDPFTGE